MNNFIELLITGTAFSLITISFGQFLDKEKKAGKILGFLFYFSYGFIILSFLTDRLKFPHISYISYPIIYFTGAIIFYYLRTKIEGRIKLKAGAFFLFMPALLSFFLLLPYYLQCGKTKASYPAFENFTNSFLKISYYLIIHSIVFWIIFCLALFVLQAYLVMGKKSFDYIKQTKVMIVYSILWIIPAIMLIFSFIFKNAFLIKIIILFANSMLIFFYFLNNRYPHFFNAIQKDVSEKRYKKSRIKGINVKEVILRIQELMELEKIYSDENMTLDKLSNILDITKYQLSEILNSELKTNYNSFINSYRIKEAKKLLIENLNNNILHIGFECGFNSKTAFNRVFLRLESITPSLYREKFKKKISTRS